MKRLLVVICWICVISIGAFLRFDDLAKRPFHADEATGARITANRMAGEGRFDPKHYHGPLFHMAAATICEVRGESEWRTMTKQTLRLLPVVAGTLLLLAPLFWRRRFGDLATLAASAFLATSPLLVYYSRMFIHEILLALVGILALAVFCGKPRLPLAGILIGLMFAIKETFAISMIAWTAAALPLWWENRSAVTVPVAVAWARVHWKDVVVCGIMGLVTSMLIYTDFLRHPAGAVDAVKTFFVYETVGGHEKPFGYYFDLLALPHRTSGLWWFGTPLILIAGLALCLPEADAGRRNTVRFVGYSALGHVIIYSLIAYKTPWLLCLPVAHLCLLAGFAYSGFPQRGRVVRGVLIVLGLACLATQFTQARRATGRLASDDRNPYAYVPTRSDVESLETWLVELRRSEPGISLEPVAVVGSDYWPLPWYLRDFTRIGYWPEPPGNLSEMSLVFAMPETEAAVAAALSGTHTGLPRGLRAGVPVVLFLRNDIWNQWKKEEPR